MDFSIKFSEVENEINIIAQQIEECRKIIDLIEKFPPPDQILYSKELEISRNIINLKKILLNRLENLRRALDICEEIDYNISIFSEILEVNLNSLEKW